jgi:hypothetical protein
VLADTGDQAPTAANRRAEPQARESTTRFLSHWY